MAYRAPNRGTPPTGIGGDTYDSSADKLFSNTFELFTYLGCDPETGALPDAIPVSCGGTGGNTPQQARDSLSLYSKDETDSKLTQVVQSTEDSIAAVNDKVKPITEGGTGANNVFNARSNLDVYSKSEVDSLVAAGGEGNVVGVAGGGTGATTASQARTNLDVYSKTESNFLALPLGTPIWHNGTRLTIDDGYASYDGQLLNRADFPSLWAKVQSKFVVITDADWLADPTKRAAYSSGNGTTTFRMPDLNGFLADSIKGLHLRGDGNGTIAGETVLQSTILKDAIRDIQGTTPWKSYLGDSGGAYTNSTSVTGAFVSGTRTTGGNTLAGATWTSVSSSTHAPMEFKASNVVPTAGENRPVSAVGIWICRVSAGTAEQVLPNTAPSLTGGNTWGGSQNIQGDLTVSGKLEADIKPLLNASGSLPIYALRSWGIVEGTATPARLVKGGNIASVVDVGVGQYKITFATPMPDLNYGVLFGSTTYTLNDPGTYGTMKIGTKTVNGFIISCGQQGYVDVSAVSFGVIY